MVFSSIPFLFFFLPAVLIVYYLLPRRMRNFWLLVSGLVFYGYGEPVYIVLMLFSILTNYALGLAVSKWQKHKKALLISGVVINLLMLGYFKYLGFFASMISGFFPSLTVKSVALPIGISFYTFQTMSYLIDVYRGDCSANRNLIDFGAYVTMFPQLIAGPIVRYKDIEYQLKNRAENAKQFSDGVVLFTVGLAKKVLLANTLGSLWDILSASPESGLAGKWIGLLSFSLQIYFDFSGYSDIARGMGKFFGFEFVKNFDYPYCVSSVTEFWRKWHISLGTWFKEYVYIPLGGNRKGLLRQCVNMMIVWTLTGMWHGASWNFVLWGAYFGIILIAEKTFLLKLQVKWPRFLRHIYALLLVLLGWGLFAITDFTALSRYFAGLFVYSATSANIYSDILYALPVLLISVFACLPVCGKIYDRYSGKKAFDAAEIVFIAVLLTLSVAALVSSSYNPFLYFRF